MHESNEATCTQIRPRKTFQNIKVLCFSSVTVYYNVPNLGYDRTRWNCWRHCKCASVFHCIGHTALIRFKDIVAITVDRISGVARGVGGKWRHAPWGAVLGGASAHFLQSF